MSIRVLRVAGLRATSARLAVYESLVAAKRPLSHAELLALDSIHGMDKVTLYRVLKALEEVSLIHQVRGVDSVWRYCAHAPDSTGCPGDHAHFLCEVCGEMTCLLSCSLPFVELPEGYEVKGKQMVVYGRCACCGGKG